MSYSTTIPTTFKIYAFLKDWKLRDWKIAKIDWWGKSKRDQNFTDSKFLFERNKKYVTGTIKPYPLIPTIHINWIRLKRSFWQ